MDNPRHGLFIGIEHSGRDHFFISIKAIGKLTHQDYQLMVPLLEAAIEGTVQPELYALVDVTELQGWDAEALWDDLKLGVTHGRDFKKIAVVGRSGWQQWMTKVADWFTPIDIEYFYQRQAAVDWLEQAVNDGQHSSQD